MFSKKLTLLLIISTIVPFITCADEVKTENLIVTGISDGTAPAYNCSAGATLPFFPLDSSSVTETIPAGDPIIKPEPIFTTCNTLTGPLMCEYSCETDIASAICVGFDCINDESFTEGETMKLKENNLRIRFDISTIDPTQLGRSWNISANSSRNNGASYFGFDVKSLEADTVYLVTAADGVVSSYNCSLPANPFAVYPAVRFDDIIDGIIAVGEPLVRPQFVDPLNCSGSFPDQLCVVECVEVLDFEEKSLLTLGPGPDPTLGDGVAVGYESSTESGVISVGRTDLVRRLAHVAAGTGANDAMTLADLDTLNQQLTDANTQLDAIEVEVVFLEERLENVVPEVLSEIDIILNDPSVSDKAKKILNKSKQHLDKALEELEKGDVEKAFKEINKAIEKLLKAEEEEEVDVLNLIDQLVEALLASEARI